MVTWKEFAQADPALSEAGCNQLFQYEVGLAFLATVQEDGSPRLHPVCPVLSDSHLYILVSPNSPKRWDLQRDGRYALQAFPQDRPDSDEFYLTGTAKVVDDIKMKSVVLANAKHHASPDEILFELLQCGRPGKVSALQIIIPSTLCGKPKMQLGSITSHLKGKGCPTQRAPDGWESARFQVVCMA